MQVFHESGATSGTVPDVRADHARRCQALAGNPSRRLKLIGVSGQRGKTTTSCLIAGVLTAAGYRIGILGSLGYLDGRGIEPAAQATPPPEKLAALLARMADNECTHAVMTVSSRALAESRIAGTSFDAMCLTGRLGIGVAGRRLDLGRDRPPDPLPSARRPLGLSPFCGLADQGFAVINADDHGAASWLRRLNRPVLTVGIDASAEITAVPMEQCPSEQTFLLTAGSETAAVRTQMIGKHHVSNCLVAAAVGLAYDIDLTTVVRGLESVGQVPGRLERIECGQSFSVFVDGARTPAALAAVLRALRPVAAGRLICVFSADHRANRAQQERLGRIAEKHADQVVLTSSDARRAGGSDALGDVLSGLHRPAAATVIADRLTAIHWALGAAGPGDCLLIAGKRHDAAGPLGRRPMDDDREIARVASGTRSQEVGARSYELASRWCPPLKEPHVEVSQRASKS